VLEEEAATAVPTYSASRRLLMKYVESEVNERNLSQQSTALYWKVRFARKSSFDTRSVPWRHHDNDTMEDTRRRFTVNEMRHVANSNSPVVT
jgi:hypothetical protein